MPFQWSSLGTGIKSNLRGQNQGCVTAERKNGIGSYSLEETVDLLQGGL